MRNRVQAYDSPFTIARTDGFQLHNKDVATWVPSQAGNPTFDDRKGVYWFAENPRAGVQVTDTNTKIQVVKEPKDGQTITVQVGPSTK